MQVFNYDVVDSTQDLAKKYLVNNHEIAAFVANSQISGYGKQGRYFYSPANTGIYLSVAVPSFVPNQDKIGLLTPCVATKVVETLQSFFQKSQFKLKWVNDIYLNERKIAGILAERHANGLVVGIGINISTMIFPKAISKKAGSISSTPIDNRKLTKQIIDSILIGIKDYDQGSFLEKYRSLSNIIGRKIELKIGKNTLLGIAINIDEKGKIIIDLNGKTEHFASGEITKINLK